MVISYSEVTRRRAEIRSRIPFRYMSGRNWAIIRDRSVVSLGCGSVEGSQFLELKQVSSSVVGVDTDPQSGAHYSALSDVPADQHNALVAEHVLEHLTHAQMLDAFTEIARILVPGSPVIITLPNINNFGIWFHDFDHKSFCPPVDTAAILEAHGFHVTDLFGWSKHARFMRHQSMNDFEQHLCAFIEENWGLTLPHYVTIVAVRT